jgi:urease accessory protein
MTTAHAVPAAFDSYREETPPQGATGMAGKEGLLEARFAARDGETYLEHDFTRTPCHLAGTVDLDDPLPGTAVAYIQSPTGGIAQGDRHQLDIGVESNARVHITTQSASKVFSMDHNYGRLQADLSVADDGYLEYLPDPTIVHQNARYAATTRVEIGENATAVVGDIMVPGRLAHESAFAYDEYYSMFEAHTPAGLAVSDRVHLDGDDPRGPGVFGEHMVLGSLYIVSTEIDSQPTSDRLHERVAQEDLHAGATTLPNNAGVLVRVLGDRAADVNDVLTDAWSELREVLFGVETPELRKY